MHLSHAVILVTGVLGDPGDLGVNERLASRIVELMPALPANDS
jgi:hypothetical protein